ncbi:hypothetical protein HIMB114_00006270 [alpha proteobacterium HIMB114]|uniref:hypothetical protein n=1 Tax=Candidatus Pelagibacter sp. HIMB109 TaxID=3415412 RepID=UPI0001BB4744|nr:hypothetical protein HIMB114_00006270 [alpha proteobacterium HIMB114]
MQNNSKLDVESLVRATQRIYESKYENPVLKENQIENVEKFVINSSNSLCSRIIKKINLEIL